MQTPEEEEPWACALNGMVDAAWSRAWLQLKQDLAALDPKKEAAEELKKLAEAKKLTAEEAARITNAFNEMFDAKWSPALLKFTQKLAAPYMPKKQAEPKKQAAEELKKQAEPMELTAEKGASLTNALNELLDAEWLELKQKLASREVMKRAAEVVKKQEELKKQAEPMELTAEEGASLTNALKEVLDAEWLELKQKLASREVMKQAAEVVKKQAELMKQAAEDVKKQIRNIEEDPEDKCEAECSGLW